MFPCGLPRSSGLHLWGLGQRWHGFLGRWNLLADEAVKLPPVYTGRLLLGLLEKIGK
jgi:hypothetical protein